MQNVLAILLAGGAGERLFPLTQYTAKPAVRFGATYRVIDFTLSNCLNSDLRKVYVLTQYKSLELLQHLREGWSIFASEIGEYIEVIPPMKRIHEDWYLGTADAVYQNIESIAVADPELVVVLAGDQIYKMDYNEMVDWHRRHNADVTIATIRVPPEEADRFGIADIGPDHRIRGFEEKPKHGNPCPSIFDSTMVSASMGIYVFNAKLLMRALVEDAAGRILARLRTRRDPVLARPRERCRLRLPRSQRKDRAVLARRRNAGRLLRGEHGPGIRLAHLQPLRPAVAFAHAHGAGSPGEVRLRSRRAAHGRALDSIVSNGCIISGGRVTKSVLSPGVRVNSYCEIDSSILMDRVEVGRHSRLQRTIVPSGAIIPENSVIGYDLEADRAAGYTVTDTGLWWCRRRLRNGSL
jgi:glucose-1-phosphate adenylyltransferase